MQKLFFGFEISHGSDLKNLCGVRKFPLSFFAPWRLGGKLIFSRQGAKAQRRVEAFLSSPPMK
jgi:hypothetical protein